ncbi:Transposase DDE domain group 1 [Carnobacterium iners]|uniref:Transposase DDE domain group 1 n=1 Tax=Carnobacterium iners TaxID=1073423 RepID=A0A1X7N9D6_9LACT|nr:Transposase DDE domain group 1 [Carnobacterium iners]SMH34129.1 Transposase DDE domain group 1 [Carnobacterium iners]
MVREFLEKIQFDELVKRNVHFEDNRKFFAHSKNTTFLQLLYQLILGYKVDSAANALRHDPIFKLILNEVEGSSQSTISRLLSESTEKNLDELNQLTQALVKLFHESQASQEVVLDLDSTHSDTFGHQESTDYNAHYGTTGYHPLLAFDGLTGLFLGAKLRSGNQYTSKGVGPFVRDLLDSYKNRTTELNILIRGDSGFATPEIYELADDYSVQFVIRVKANTKLQSIAEHLITYGDDTNWEETEVQYFNIAYQAKSWKKPQRVVIKSTRKGLLFRHEFVTTNLSTVIHNDQVFEMYQNRGTMENYIKEIKSGFYFDKTDSSAFLTNAIRMTISGIAYNLMLLMKYLVFPKTERKSLIDTIRFRLLKVASRLTYHAHRVQVQFSSSNVYDKEFETILQNLNFL